MGESQLALTDRLWALQQLDLEIDKRLAAARKLDDGAELARQIKAGAAELASITDQKKKTEGELRDHELELKGTEEKLAREQEKLYSGRISNPRELQDLEAEAQALGRKRAKLDGEVLQLFTEVEAVTAAVVEKQNEVQQLKSQYVQIRKRFEQTVGRLKSEVEELIRQRVEARKLVEARLLAGYDELRKHLGGQVVWPVIEPSCGACKVSIGQKDWQKIKAGIEVVKCSSCSRIFHYPGKDE